MGKFPTAVVVGQVDFVDLHCFEFPWQFDESLASMKDTIEEKLNKIKSFEERQVQLDQKLLESQEDLESRRLQHESQSESCTFFFKSS